MEQLFSPILSTAATQAGNQQALIHLSVFQLVGYIAAALTPVIAFTIAILRWLANKYIAEIDRLKIQDEKSLTEDKCEQTREDCVAGVRKELAAVETRMGNCSEQVAADLKEGEKRFDRLFKLAEDTGENVKEMMRRSNTNEYFMAHAMLQLCKKLTPEDCEDLAELERTLKARMQE